ncbi:hypothetical protein MRX96_030747 [Rhipicephalus microplus]
MMSKRAIRPPRRLRQRHRCPCTHLGRLSVTPLKVHYALRGAQRSARAHGGGEAEDKQEEADRKGEGANFIRGACRSVRGTEMGVSSRRKPSTSTGEDECVTRRGHCRSRTRDSKSAVKEAEQPTRDRVWRIAAPPRSTKQPYRRTTAPRSDEDRNRVCGLPIVKVQITSQRRDECPAPQERAHSRYTMHNDSSPGRVCVCISGRERKHE